MSARCSAQYTINKESSNGNMSFRDQEQSSQHQTLQRDQQRGIPSNLPKAQNLSNKLQIKNPYQKFKQSQSTGQRTQQQHQMDQNQNPQVANFNGNLGNSDLSYMNSTPNQSPIL